MSEADNHTNRTNFSSNGSFNGRTDSPSTAQSSCSSFPQESGHGNHQHASESEFAQRQRTMNAQRKQLSSIDWKGYTLYARIEAHTIEISRLNAFNATRTTSGSLGGVFRDNFSRRREEANLDAHSREKLRRAIDTSYSSVEGITEGSDTEVHPHEVIYTIVLDSPPVLCTWYSDRVSHDVGEFAQSTGDPFCGCFVVYTEDRGLLYFAPSNWDGKVGYPTQVSFGSRRCLGEHFHPLLLPIGAVEGGPQTALHRTTQFSPLGTIYGNWFLFRLAISLQSSSFASRLCMDRWINVRRRLHR